jgi:hypothetical protein
MNLQTPRAITFLTSMGLRGVIRQCILNDANSSTYDRGTTIIHGIFASGDVEVRSAGYLPYGKGLPAYTRLA